MDAHTGYTARRGTHAPHNVAKLPFEIAVSLSREQLRPAYGQDFRTTWLTNGNNRPSAVAQREADDNASPEVGGEDIV